MTFERDRDAGGRALNARARDRLGRPMPRGQVGVAPLADDRELTPIQALVRAQELLDTGYPFQAHEVLEAAWKSAPQAHRQLWQGLAQLAVGLTHAARGNMRGAGVLLERGAANMLPFVDGPPHRIDVEGVTEWARSTLVLLSAVPNENVAIEPPRLVTP